MVQKIMLCDCGGSQRIDVDAIGAATGVSCSRVHTALCTRQLPRLAKALQAGETVVACAQETAVFDALAEEIGADAPLGVDIRDRAGWSDEGADAAPKMAALLAEALLPRPPAKTMDVTSEGLCLILGTAEVALPAARRLADALSVTCLLPEMPDPADALDRRFDIHVGRLRRASGALGGFEIIVDGFRTRDPAGRGAPIFTAPADGAVSACDLILDLTGEAPLFPAPGKREGYFRADPGRPQAVADAVFDAAQMVGTFEKPLYVRLDESLCAHSRASKTGCTRCLDLCPTGAITPAGDHVAIDADICAGCGACAAVCPSGAVAYDDPPTAHLFRRLTTLAQTFRKAGGTAPRLLVHDAAHGREMIALSARFGRGLPARVIPLELAELATFGHAEMLAALGVGFASVTILPGPDAERDAITPQIALAEAIAGPDRVAILDVADPDALSEALYAAAPPAPVTEPVLPMGGRREVTRLAARALTGSTDAIPLPDGAPYGAVLVDTDACTLCLACASLCPPGALADHPDTPQLNFREDACLQCGLCAAVCPENAITLEPRLNLADRALSEQVLNEEEPYACIECGRPFGVKSTIERIVAKLEGQHSMFTHSDNARLIRMCDDCRVTAQYHGDAAPFAAAPRPRVRTTEDYLKDRDSDG